MTGTYLGIVSSDWNECLAPCGPFDVLAHTYPEISQELDTVFRSYTANVMPLSTAVRRIARMLPARITPSQMDAYLAEAFRTYRGVANLISWCADRDILFMINTTGMIGYFQRVFALGLLPRVPVLGAHPMVRFDAGPADPGTILPLRETADKAVFTRQAAETAGVPPERVILLGDSGGDGPHFKWGAEAGALCIGCMPKASLKAYADSHGFGLPRLFGVSYLGGGMRDPAAEMRVDFGDLKTVISARMAL